MLSDADLDTIAPNVERNRLAVDAVVCSEEHRRYKPHASLFYAVCTAIGVDPGHTAYVGDHPSVDIVGARNAGLVAIWLNRNNESWPSDLEPPDHVIATLHAVPPIISGPG